MRGGPWKGGGTLSSIPALLQARAQRSGLEKLWRVSLLLLSLASLPGAPAKGAAAGAEGGVLPGASMPDVQTLERRWIAAAYPARYNFAAAARRPCASWSTTGDTDTRVHDAIGLAESGRAEQARASLASYLASPETRRSWTGIEAAARVGGPLGATPSEEIEGVLYALYAAGSLEAASGEPRAIALGREHLIQALACAQVLVARGEIAAMEPMPAMEALPVPVPGCGVRETSLSVYDLYNNLLVADLVEPVERHARQGASTAPETPVTAVLLRLQREPDLAARAPVGALSEADRLLRWAYRPAPLLAANLATLLAAAEPLAPPESLRALRGQRDELAEMGRQGAAGPPSRELVAMLTRLELLRSIDSRTPPSLPGSWAGALSARQQRMLAAVRFSVDRSRSPGAVDSVDAAQAEAVLGPDSSAWFEAVRRDTAPSTAAVVAKRASQIWEAHRMKILVVVGAAASLAALYVIGRWTVIQLRHRAALLTSFYRRETEELRRKSGARR
jgi:hypothetical protein